LAAIHALKSRQQPYKDFLASIYSTSNRRPWIEIRYNRNDSDVFFLGYTRVWWNIIGSKEISDRFICL